MTTATIETKRRDGYYEITAPGRLFHVCKDYQRGGWTMREWFGPVGGWSSEDHFATLSQSKAEAATRCGF